MARKAFQMGNTQVSPRRSWHSYTISTIGVFGVDHASRIARNTTYRNDMWLDATNKLAVKKNIEATQTIFGDHQKQ
jgi:hypothetical protein